MEAFSALLAICAGNSQRPVTRSFDVFFDLRLNKRLSKQSWGWWFETPSSPLWRHCNLHTRCHLLWEENTSVNFIGTKCITLSHIYEQQRASQQQCALAPSKPESHLSNLLCHCTIVPLDEKLQGLHEALGLQETLVYIKKVNRDSLLLNSSWPSDAILWRQHIV